MAANFKNTLGAIIIGIPLAIMFSGVLIVACIMYWRSTKPTDTWRMSCIVSSLLVLDLFHSCALWASAWKWFITNRGMDPDNIPVMASLSVLVSGISALIVHSMYSWRIFLFSKRKYWLALPIMALAVVRFVLVTSVTAYMIKIPSFEAFGRSGARFVFTAGVGLSCIVDALITGTMMIILRQSREQSVSLDSVIDSLVLYTLETGSAAVIATIAMLIAWLVMPDNLIFLALNFIIAKLYANSIVAMLNYRQSLRQRATHSSSKSGGTVDLDHIRLNHKRFNFFGSGRNQNEVTSNLTPMEVNVTKTMQMHVDDSLMDEPSPNSKSIRLTKSEDPLKLGRLHPFTMTMCKNHELGLLRLSQLIIWEKAGAVEKTE
ncbi:hypothetical protein BT96DRAFT_974806 [Gymnopus androsaceus JB14]|uniref:DUF6534 domain-containing protein n=1 Tax=Gymnopus androsaceus JB14 TaxID=1447944 RepID=A0A6A4HQP6_9AGAR|nr:hypothetical protein BT96DRAFT_974806 [Gymnopus androsaceus JB14]